MTDFDSLVGGMDRVILDTFKKPNDGVQYTPSAGGDPVAVDAVWDRPFAEAEIGRMGATAEAPQVFVRLSDLPDDPESGDPTFTIEAKAYRVVQVQRDGIGGAVIILAER